MSDKPRGSLGRILAVLIVLGAGVGAGWLLHGQYGTASRAATEGIVRDYLLANPEILPEAMQNLQHKEVVARLGKVRAQVETPYPGVVLGNPNGKVTLVEFTDYACGFCRKSVADVTALIAANPDLKVVMRELPILSPASTQAARWALVAAHQGRYPAFHDAMFAASPPSEQSIAIAARNAGLDLAGAQALLTSQDVDAELQKNLDLAQQLNFEGTPSWVIGDTVLSGAVGEDVLQKAINAARRN